MMKSVLRVRGDVVMHWHHIVPKYEGGTDDPSNLVHLTVEDHAIAHLVRYRMFKDHRDKWAYQILAGLIDGEEFIRKGCRTTQKRLMKEGRHNFQKEDYVNPSTTPKMRKMHSERMKGNTLGSLRNMTPEFRAKQAEGAKGNTNVRGRIWICNDVTGEKRRVSPNENIPKGFRKGCKLNVST